MDTAISKSRSGSAEETNVITTTVSKGNTGAKASRRHYRNEKTENPKTKRSKIEQE